MTIFTLKCETFVRLANVCSSFSPKLDEEARKKLNVIRLENTNGDLVAVASNHVIACVEKVGKATDVDSFCEVRLDAALLTQLKQEALYGSFLTVNILPELANSTCQTTMGWLYPNCCAWHDDSPLKKWRNWGVENAVQSSGSMYWDVDEVEILLRSSPTGKVIFPEFINVDQPVTLRDRYSPDWVGLFMPRPDVGEIVRQKAELPEWWGK